MPLRDRFISRSFLWPRIFADSRWEVGYVQILHSVIQIFQLTVLMSSLFLYHYWRMDLCALLIDYCFVSKVFSITLNYDYVYVWLSTGLCMWLVVSSEEGVGFVGGSWSYGWYELPGVTLELGELSNLWSPVNLFLKCTLTLHARS